MHLTFLSKCAGILFNIILAKISVKICLCFDKNMPLFISLKMLLVKFGKTTVFKSASGGHLKEIIVFVPLVAT